MMWKKERGGCECICLSKDASHRVWNSAGSELLLRRAEPNSSRMACMKYRPWMRVWGDAARESIWPRRK